RRSHRGRGRCDGTAGGSHRRHGWRSGASRGRDDGARRRDGVLMAAGYGVDVSLTDRLVTGRLVRRAAILIEAYFRRLNTARGSLARTRLTIDEDLTYGFDVMSFVGAVGLERSVFVVGGMVENELAKDDRAHDVKCETSLVDSDDGDGQMLLLDI